MCGIAGIYGPGQLEPMLARLQHRGPDESGTFADKNVQLGVRRLNVIDLTTGSQPIYNEDGSLVVVFNGEIFNYRTLRDELKKAGHEFLTESDTEVIVHAYEQWGMHCLQRFIGQYAFCLYDGIKLILVRDRMGEKPLYYHRRKDRFVFASEIKAMLPQVETRPHLTDEFWAFEMPAEGETLFEDIYEVPPATYVTFEPGKPLIVTTYWEIPQPPDYPRREDDLVEELRFLLTDAVELRLQADVPVGVSLSGGLDSSIIACLAKPEYVFSCRFALGEKYDEWHYARQIARHIGAHQVTVSPTAQDMRRMLPTIVWHLDQPIATASPIGDFMIAQAAADKVIVLLGGQGADECFGGYARYLAMTGAREDAYHTPLLEPYRPMLDYLWSCAEETDAAGRYFHLLQRMACDEPARHKMTVRKYFQSYQDPVDAMGYTDIHLTLPALIQMNDRSTAAYGLENRNPFLDHRLVEFAFSLPPGLKIKEWQTKYLLRRAVRDLVPEEILNRKDKKGLVVPFGPWLSNLLNDWRENLLLSLQQRLVLPVMPARRREFDRSHYTLITLELWFRNFFPDWRADQ